MTITWTCEFSEISAATLYSLLRLRVDVFVVEQNCPYPELDGRDAEATTRHVWVAEAGEPMAYLRILSEPDGYRIGRVCTAVRHRGKGLANQLMTEALRYTGSRPVRLDAQTPVVAFYQRHGFVVNGPEFLDDGIPHLPMRRS